MTRDSLVATAYLGLSCRAAAKISDGSQYYILLIITDGVISDMTQTKEAIVSVSLRRKAWEGRVTVYTVKRLRCLFHVYPNNFTCQFQRCILAGAQRTLACNSLGSSMMPDEPTKEMNLSNASLLQSAKKHVMPFVPGGQSPFYVIFYLLLI